MNVRYDRGSLIIQGPFVVSGVHELRGVEAVGHFLYPFNGVSRPGTSQVQWDPPDPAQNVKLIDTNPERQPFRLHT